MKRLSTREKRKYPRIEAKVQVTFRTVQDLVAEYTKNISKGGIFLKTDQLLDPNAEIDLLMSFPNDLGDFHVKGRVVRLVSMSHPTDAARQLYGAGIRFLDPNPAMLAVIEQIIASAPDPGEE
ncbi:MAG: PilZ domain-containing protein [Pseudomonadota bacterium]